MARRKRYLVLSDLASSKTADFAERQQADFADCPAAARYSDEEAEDFLLVAMTYDFGVPGKRPDLGKPLRKVGISYPPDLTYDSYRMGRHIFRRWGDQQFRKLIIGRVMHVNAGSWGGVLRRKLTAVMEMVEHYLLAAGVAALRLAGLDDLIPAVKSAFSPEQQAHYAAVLLYGKLTLHRFITEPEPARAPSRWEQRKLLRRLRLRQVQMRSLRRSLYHLRRERKALLSRLRALSEEAPEVRLLAEQLEAVEAERQAAESRHAEAAAAQRLQYEAAIAALRTQVEAVRADHAQALALRDRLLGATRR
ncbi:MAG TPA: hypothetical protein VD969_21560 [Symbiobacteriaceae bacterium]|nr:hypothetical protein [Symbiobacteriaceae bacterium]